MSPRTPGQQHAFEEMAQAMEAAIAGRPRYPEPIAFVPTDIQGSGEAVRDYRARGLTVALVFPDGEVEVLDPPAERAAASPRT